MTRRSSRTAAGRRPRPIPRTGAPAGVVAGAGGALMVIGAFLSWLSTSSDAGGSTVISGFGTISGGSTLAGQNLNDLLSIGGLGTFRPGLIGLIFGSLAVLGGIAVALQRPRGAHSFRVAAVFLLLCGVVGAGWGLYRSFAPGTAGILAAGDGSAGTGPWMTAAGGLVIVAAGCWLLAGRADPTGNRPLGNRGIQA
ncbi:MAG: hypothetical protein ACR2P2_00770 [Nakamurella sp.]